ncbi:hypothetical protein GXY_01508 [Novacetimonas hansenii ATCC 23769]|uniref:Uncharacterized protein n=1 Tax=Novacetimonas hansenii ATCC 23769 TaxID=714995 RepID=D5QB28_NOVHA|nr:hypothetical protein GXY_01508 [Novacetimonas hansenii ATCC 23769]
MTHDDAGYGIGRFPPSHVKAVMHRKRNNFPASASHPA